MLVRRGALSARLGPGARRRAADPSRAGRDLPGGSGARRSAGGCGGAGRRRTGSPVPAGACVVVAGPRTRSRGAARRGRGRRVDRRGARAVHVSAGEQPAVGTGRSGAGESGDRRGRCGGRGRAGSQVDRRGERGVLVRDGPPDAAMEAAKVWCWTSCPPIVGAEMAWALASIHGDAGRTAEAVAVAEAGYAIAIRCSDAPHMRFNIADAHVGALVLAGRIGEALEVAEWARGAGGGPTGDGALARAGDRGSGGAGGGTVEMRRARCWNRRRARCRRTGHEHGLGVSVRRSACDGVGDAGPVRRGGGRARGARSGATSVPVAGLRDEVWRGRGWLPGRVRSARRSESCCRRPRRPRANERFAAEVVCLQTATQFGDRSCEARLRELEGMVEGPRVGLAARFAGAMHDGDAAELVALSEDFEEIGRSGGGGRCGCAGEHLAYRRQDLRGSALGCAATGGGAGGGVWRGYADTAAGT